jgi:outer membrane protein assembly factor BamE (lipoprotein component of BamABCDE complex)
VPEPEETPLRRRVPTPATAALLLALLPVSACSVFEAPTYVRGNRVDPDQLKELVVGTSSKADASSLLGSPTSHATFDDNRWIYIGEVTQPQIGRYPDVVTQDVVVLTFDQGGILRGVQHLTQKNAQSVAMAPGATPSPGSEASFLQQLLGNVGRFNPGALGSGGGPGPGI